MTRLRGLTLSIIAVICSLLSASQPVEKIIQRSSGGHAVDLAISSDGMLLAKITDAMEGEIEIWNTRTGHLVRILRTTSSGGMSVDPLMRVRFWRGSKNIVTGTTNGMHQVYDVATGKLQKQVDHQSYVGGVFAVNESTGTMVTISALSFLQNQLIFTDLYSGNVYDSLSIDITGVTALEFSPTGKQLAMGTSKGAFTVMQLDSLIFALSSDKVHDSTINYMQWTKDDYLLVSTDTEYSLWHIPKRSITSNGKLKDRSRIVASPVEDAFFFFYSYRDQPKIGEAGTAGSAWSPTGSGSSY